MICCWFDCSWSTESTFSVKNNSFSRKWQLQFYSGDQQRMNCFSFNFLKTRIDIRNFSKQNLQFHHRLTFFWLDNHFSSNEHAVLKILLEIFGVSKQNKCWKSYFIDHIKLRLNYFRYNQRNWLSEIHIVGLFTTKWILLLK